MLEEITKKIINGNNPLDAIKINLYDGQKINYNESKRDKIFSSLYNVFDNENNILGQARKGTIEKINNYNSFRDIADKGMLTVAVDNQLKQKKNKGIFSDSENTSIFGNI